MKRGTTERPVGAYQRAADGGGQLWVQQSAGQADERFTAVALASCKGGGALPANLQQAGIVTQGASSLSRYERGF